MQREIFIPNSEKNTGSTPENRKIEIRTSSWLLYQIRTIDFHGNSFFYQLYQAVDI